MASHDGMLSQKVEIGSQKEDRNRNPDRDLDRRRGTPDEFDHIAAHACSVVHRNLPSPFIQHQDRYGSAAYLPPQAADGPLPVLDIPVWTDLHLEDSTVKAGAQRYATEPASSSSPRTPAHAVVNLPGENDSYDFGSGAGSYVDATQEPWKDNYHMYS